MITCLRLQRSKFRELLCFALGLGTLNGGTMLEVRNLLYKRAQQIGRVPHDDYCIEDVYGPEQLSNPHGDSDGDQLTDEHAAKTPERHRQMSDQRVHFVRTHAKCNHCG